MNIELQNLLYRDKENNVNAPYSQATVAKMFKETGTIEDINGLVQVRFKDKPMTNQRLEGSEREKEVTGHGTLAIITQYTTGRQITLILEAGTEAIVISQWYDNYFEPEAPGFTQIYRDKDVQHMTQDQLVHVMNSLSDFDYLPKPKLQMQDEN